MKKSLLLLAMAILLLGLTQKFDGQETTPGHRQLPPGSKAAIERQSKMAKASFVSRQEPNQWTADHILAGQHQMTTPPGQRDFRANATMTGKSLAQNELSAGVDTAWVRNYASGLAPGEDDATAIAVDDVGNIYVTGSSAALQTGCDYLTVKYDATGSQLWIARYNGPENDDDRAHALAVDGSGNVYVTGASVGLHTWNDYVTVKYSSAGVEQWVARYNGPGNAGDYAHALAVDAFGNVYVTGASVGLNTSSDYATVKYDSDGIEQWVARYNSAGTLYDGAMALAVDAFGNVYVTGEGGSLTTGTEYATVKYNSSGIQQWVVRYNGPGNAGGYALALAVDASGNVYVTGTSATIKYNSDGIQQWVALKSANDLTVDASGNVYVAGSSMSSREYQDYDYATVKFNSDGVEQWVARYNWQGDADDQAKALAVDAFGNVYVTGYSGSRYTVYDYATVKYNSEGIQQWVARYNGPGNGGDQTAAVAVDASGNIYVTGQCDLFYGEWGNLRQGGDYATVKYNSIGTELWVARYNGPGKCDDQAAALAVDASGNVFVTGASVGSGTEHDYATIKYDSAGAEQWVARYNGLGNSDDWANALAVDASGNVYVTGMSADSLGMTYGCECATVKYNSAGTEQWIARYKGNFYAEAKALALDASGNVYLTGYSDVDYLTVKYNSDGVQQWVARYNGPKNDWDVANSLAVDASGNVYVTGESCIDWMNDYYDYATIKYDSAGAEQWVARYNGPGNAYDGATALAVDAAGNVYVTGKSEGTGPRILAYDYATVKYNFEGVQQWVARYNGPANSYDEASALVVDAAGNVYVTGGSEGTGAPPSYDYATVKYNYDGVQQWVARYNGPGNSWDEANSMVVDASGNVYVTGLSYGSGTGDDYATVKYNSAGVQQWVARYNGLGNADDRANALAVDNSGNVYVSGSSSKGYGINRWSFYTTIKYVQTPVSVKKEDPDMPSNYWLAQNYPNPFNPSTIISYQLPVNSYVELSIYNLLGQKVATLVAEQRSAGIHKLNWDARGLASGVYLYRLEAGSFSQSKKLILMR